MGGVTHRSRTTAPRWTTMMGSCRCVFSAIGHVLFAGRQTPARKKETAIQWFHRDDPPTWSTGTHTRYNPARLIAPSPSYIIKILVIVRVNPGLGVPTKKAPFFFLSLLPFIYHAPPFIYLSIFLPLFVFLLKQFVVGHECTDAIPTIWIGMLVWYGIAFVLAMRSRCRTGTQSGRTLFYFFLRKTGRLSWPSRKLINNIQVAATSSQVRTFVTYGTSEKPRRSDDPAAADDAIEAREETDVWRVSILFFFNEKRQNKKIELNKPIESWERGQPFTVPKTSVSCIQFVYEMVGGVNFLSTKFI